METNLKRLERLKNIRMPELSHQSADFQDSFIDGSREPFSVIRLDWVNHNFWFKRWPDFDALDVIKTKKAPFERRPESPDSDFDVEEDEEFGATGKL